MQNKTDKETPLVFKSLPVTNLNFVNRLFSVRNKKCYDLSNGRLFSSLPQCLQSTFIYTKKLSLFINLGRQHKNRIIMKTSFKDFAKEYWGLFFAVVVILTSLFSIYFIAYSNHEIDKSISATFLTCIISYIGTIGLSIFIFHNSWLKGKEEEYRHRPRLSINCQIIHLFPSSQIRSDQVTQSYLTL